MAFTVSHSVAWKSSLGGCSVLKNASEPEVSSSSRDDHVRQPVTKLSSLVWGLGRQQFDRYAAQSSAGSLSSASALPFPEEWWRKKLK
jgi:hypothetical protein